MKTTLILSNIQDDSTRDWRRGTSCFLPIHAPLLCAGISLITSTVFPVGPDEIYLFGPFNLREQVFLEAEKHTGQSPVELSAVPVFT